MERVRQGTISRKAARREMLRCAAVGVLQEDPPEWLYVDDAGPYPTNARYLMLGDVAVIVRSGADPNSWTALTVVTRHDRGGCHAAAIRQRREARYDALYPPPRVPRSRPRMRGEPIDEDLER